MHAHPSKSLDERPDRPTIARLLILTAGTAAGLTFFAPPFGQRGPADADDWLALAVAVIIGLTLPAPLFCIPRVVRGHGLGAGGTFALASGLGVLLLLPAAIIEWLGRFATPPDEDTYTMSCLYFVLSFTGLWYLLASLAAGHAGRRLFRRETPWTERYGFFLALLWSPLGAWQVIGVYIDVLN